MKRPDFGMTLIELMIVLVILAVLASIAIPSYRQYILRSHRVEAKAALLNVAAAQEKFYLQCNSYSLVLGGNPAAACASRGLGFDNATLEYYTISVDEATAQAFTIKAEANKGGQQDDSACKFLDINEQGLRRGGPSSDAMAPGTCWD